MYHCTCRVSLQMSLDVMLEKRDEEKYGSKKWIEMVDRGGLFKVNNETFSFFIELEMKLRYHLLHIFTENADTQKGSIISSLMDDDSILFSWIFISRELDENDSKELLHQVIEMWLTIRGYSTAGAWMEHYKQIKKDVIQGKHALRKDLARKDNEDK